jgi:hypothetical protein
MNYKVLITAPAINEEVVLSADSPEEAKALALASCANRAPPGALAGATVTVEEMPTASA